MDNSSAQAKIRQMILPGDPTRAECIDTIVRVDHAGEKGAERIYSGQIDALHSNESRPIVEEMRAQELKHLYYFESQIPNYGRPTVLLPIWNTMGYLLGYVSAKIDVRAAMAVTVAIEQVIAEHYLNQHEQLKRYDRLSVDTESLNADLKAKILEFRDDEIEHEHTGLEHDAEQAPFYRPIKTIVSAISRCAIFLSRKYRLCAQSVKVLLYCIIHIDRYGFRS